MRLPDKTTETSCRSCGVLIRKRRDKSGNGFEWVSYLGREPNGGDHVFSRFCMEEGKWNIRVNPRRQHAPIPIDNPKKLERWLNS